MRRILELMTWYREVEKLWERMVCLGENASRKQSKKNKEGNLGNFKI